MEGKATRVESASKPGTFYTVDYERGTCTCWGFTRWKRCRHLQGEPPVSDPQAAMYAAIVAFQKEVQPATKDAVGQVGQNRNYTYADLNAVWEAARDPLTNNGLAVVQMVGPYLDGKQFLKTILVHKDGGSIEWDGSIPCAQSTAQGAGSAITYLRRYSLCATLGLITEEDDDGVEASRPEPRREQPKQERRPEPEQPREQKPAGNVDAWKKMTDLMKEEQVGKAHIEPVIGGFNANILNDWLAAEEGRTVQELIMLAVEKKQGK